MATGGTRGSGGSGGDDNPDHIAAVDKFVRNLIRFSQLPTLQDYINEMNATATAGGEDPLLEKDHIGFVVNTDKLAKLEAMAKAAFGDNNVIAKKKGTIILIRTEYSKEIGASLTRYAHQRDLDLNSPLFRNTIKKEKNADSDPDDEDNKVVKVDATLVEKALKDLPDAYIKLLLAVCDATETNSDRLSALLADNLVKSGSKGYALAIDSTHTTPLRRAISDYNDALSALGHEKDGLQVSLVRKVFKPSDHPKSREVKTVDVLVMSVHAGAALQRAGELLPVAQRPYEPEALPLDNLKKLLNGMRAQRFFDEYAGEFNIEPIHGKADYRRKKAPAREARTVSGFEKHDIENWMVPELSDRYRELLTEIKGMVTAIETFQRHPQTNNLLGDVIVRSYKLRELFGIEKQQLEKLLHSDRKDITQEFGLAKPHLDWINEVIKAAGEYAIKMDTARYLSYKTAKQGPYLG